MYHKRQKSDVFTTPLLSINPFKATAYTLLQRWCRVKDPYHNSRKCVKIATKNYRIVL